MKYSFYIILIPIFFCSCNDYYTHDDFAKVKKIDSHVHLYTLDTALIIQAKKDNFQLITINTDDNNDSTIIDQEKNALKHKADYPSIVHYLSTFSLTNWDSSIWIDNVISKIKYSSDHGALGVKLWKNIGLKAKDKNGQYIMIDNLNFDTVLNYLSVNHIPLLGHFSEPRNCWLPLDQMTMESDRNYYSKHPTYHLYNNKVVPDYHVQIAARDHMLDKHSDLVFVGAHLGSLEWDVDELAKRFEKYPNMNVDMAGRAWYFEVQARDNWKKVHDFILKYYERLLYGTDLLTYKGQESAGIMNYSHKVWTHDWDFLTSNNIMQSEQFQGSFNGMKLPKKVIDHIFYLNAERIFLNNK